MSFEEDLKRYLSKVKRTQKHFDDLTEEATKTSLVMPFFQLLGYDVFNTNEFMPEFVCDVATKKGEKIDYAILKDGEPVILIEVKRAGMKLQKQQQGQLYRYFATNRCRIAILTNGVTYQFFSDLNAPNVMDDEPFLSFNLIDDDPIIYTSLINQFHKDNFDLKSIISKAFYQKYEKVVEKTLMQDLISPSDEIVKYFLLRPEVKTGNRITSQMIEKYREATKRAMKKVLGVTIENSILELQPQENNDDEHTETPKTVETSNISTPQSITDEIIKLLTDCLSDFSFQQEENDDYLKLHIYSVERKFGIIKISKSDCSIQLRKIGTPAQDLSSVDEIKKYL
ncbi:MAG: type I restriction endonuclease [Clostridia bacterium]|nr:type I restriction endonuclease [Clostridia bacterium]